eukprot:4773285-Amphidinium_carterae.2
MIKQAQEVELEDLQLPISPAIPCGDKNRVVQTKDVMATTGATWDKWVASMKQEMDAMKTPTLSEC